jgi:small subunit ribosomal protein S17
MGSLMRGKGKQKQGEIISAKMDKTVVIRVIRSFRHPIYGKLIKKWKKYYAHDEKNEFKLGQIVNICETRPLSRLKRWKVLGLVEKQK